MILAGIEPVQGTSSPASAQALFDSAQFNDPNSVPVLRATCVPVAAADAESSFKCYPESALSQVGQSSVCIYAAASMNSNKIRMDSSGKQASYGRPWSAFCRSWKLVSCK